MAVMKFSVLQVTWTLSGEPGDRAGALDERVGGHPREVGP